MFHNTTQNPEVLLACFTSHQRYKHDKLQEQTEAGREKKRPIRAAETGFISYYSRRSVLEMTRLSSNSEPGLLPVYHRLKSLRSDSFSPLKKRLSFFSAASERKKKHEITAEVFIKLDSGFRFCSERVHWAAGALSHHYTTSQTQQIH